MKRFTGLCLAAVLILMAACNNQNSKTTNTETSSSNVLLMQSSLPFQALPFDKIHDGDFAPAFEKGMKDQMISIDTIANNTAAPSFDNTFLAMEKSSDLLTRVNLAFNLLSGARASCSLFSYNVSTR